jgi:hypothetical protein
MIEAYDRFPTIFMVNHLKLKFGNTDLHFQM